MRIRSFILFFLNQIIINSLLAVMLVCSYWHGCSQSLCNIHLQPLIVQAFGNVELVSSFQCLMHRDFFLFPHVSCLFLFSHHFIVLIGLSILMYLFHHPSICCCKKASGTVVYCRPSEQQKKNVTVFCERAQLAIKCIARVE